MTGFGRVVGAGQDDVTVGCGTQGEQRVGARVEVVGERHIHRPPVGVAAMQVVGAVEDGGDVGVPAVLTDEGPERVRMAD